MLFACLSDIREFFDSLFDQMLRHLLRGFLVIDQNRIAVHGFEPSPEHDIRDVQRVVKTFLLRR